MSQLSNKIKSLKNICLNLCKQINYNEKINKEEYALTIQFWNDKPQKSY